MSASTGAAVLPLLVQHADGSESRTSVTVTTAYNFGYAARDQAGVTEHVNQMRALGVPAPNRVPALFPIPPDRITTNAALTVSGDQTYGEVEFALVNSEEHGWLVTIASDHSDVEIEHVNMPKAKVMCSNVLGNVAWPLADVLDVWDAMVLRMWSGDDADTTLMQQDKTAHLLRPEDLLRQLEERRGSGLPVGSVVLSGTIAGEPTPGKVRWSAELEDPSSGRSLKLAYTVRGLAEEI
jgi:hypothetical protein